MNPILRVIRFLSARGRSSVLVLLLLLFAATSKAQDGTHVVNLSVDPSTTIIHWTLVTVLHTVHGTFKVKSGIIHLDTETGKMSGAIIVGATSGESANSARDQKMHKEVLESSRYPEIAFRPTSTTAKFDLTKAGTITVDGIFNLHGQDHALKLNVDVHPQAGTIAFTTHFTVPYVEWGMKDPSTFLLRVEKEVTIDVEATAHAAR